MDLYDQRIMDLARAAASHRRLDEPYGSATVDNPLCGDRVTIDVRVDGGAVTEVGHVVRGCALCRAATALLAGLVGGLPIQHLRSGHDALSALLRCSVLPAEPWDALEVFSPVMAHPSRHDCVLLPFRAAAAAVAHSRAET